MNARYRSPFFLAALVFALIGACTYGLSNSQEPSKVETAAKKSPESRSPISTAAKALEVLKLDEGTWDAAVTLWPRPGSEPDKCVIESWMTFGDSAEFKGAEMVLTRAKQDSKIETNRAKGDSQMKLGNFSVSLAVKDIGTSRAFYEKLGFKVFAGDASQNWLIMQNESSTIGLFQGMFEKNIMTFNPGWDRNAATLSDFEDVRDIQKALKDQGVVLTTSADESTTGPASFTVVDPDGNQILFDQHVPSPKK